MNLNRRWRIYLAIAVAAVVAIVLSETVFDNTSEDCQQVRDLLDFNMSQGEVIAGHEGDPGATAQAYQDWADGLAQRAGQINDPDLAPHALRVAQAAARFVVVLPQVPDNSDGALAPAGTKTPDAVYELAGLNDLLTAETRILDGKCQD